jgi:hypothetical protein
MAILLVNLLVAGERMALFSLHTSFDLLELTFASKELLSLLVDLSLHLDLDFAEFLLLASELLFLEPYRLRSEVFWVH